MREVDGEGALVVGGVLLAHEPGRRFVEWARRACSYAMAIRGNVLVTLVVE
ncbi:hypothetical protein [Streptomyces sp. NBC_01803]|uniref:hypothetical protein n=1 Tax=Streptomyces sp. NBC_01803 TaxID=2975946 RepID=UPI002DD94101|nr:hypothetical protein [Streptomyces sp. NBC_01803]WSA44652.1 hypothetical protein OIE51_10805 [Streptomyces sp. NBC_01803]